ncbi:hypothetical protein IC582_014655 [Cucumis melo]
MLKCGSIMASNFHGFFFIFIFIIFSYLTLFVEAAALVPAMFVFGDSLVDVGNNNYLNFSSPKANFYPNGIDFPTGKPTGRFCNGKNPADFLAEKVGLASAPSYLSIIENSSRHTHNINRGINFAFGGATIIPQSNQIISTSISLCKQVVYYNSIYKSLVKDLGVNKAKAYTSKSLYFIEIGSNDIFAYFASTNLRKTYIPPQYLDLMFHHFEKQLKILYKNGARKLVVIGVGVVGCTPAMRYQNISEGCNSEMNWLAFVYNQHLISMLNRLKDELFGFHFSFFDGFSIMLTSIHKPNSFGFSEVKAACCGFGRLKAEMACIPKASYCNNREKYLFWDKYHPTQQAHRFFSDLIFNGPQKYTFPINVQTLIAI